MSLVKTPKKHKKNEVFDLFFQSKTYIFPVQNVFADYSGDQLNLNQL
jgi:hypothetical protein